MRTRAVHISEGQEELEVHTESTAIEQVEAEMFSLEWEEVFQRS